MKVVAGLTERRGEAMLLVCGRFTLAAPALLKAMYPKRRFPDVQPRYNIAPAQPVLALRNTSAEPEFMVWGHDGSINARAETVALKPAFRDAARLHRALVFADGYYEWRSHADGKQPYYVRRRDGEAFAFAALWYEQPAPTGEWERTCVLITKDASPGLAAIHDRMPVILAAAGREAWLASAALDDARIGLALRETSNDLESYPVSLAVNRVTNDDRSLIEPVKPPEQGSLF